MASKLVLFILTVIKVNIVSTAAFSENIHEEMTPEEISQIFGTDDGSVPKYQIFSVVLPETTRNPFEPDIHLKVKIDGTEINLVFKPTARYLATRYTPVWLAVTDQKALNKIRYDPLPNAMKDIGAFQMYQDLENQAAIVVYTDSEHGSIIEGTVTSDYVIKSLPKRLINQTLTVGDNYFSNSPLFDKRSIKSDPDEVTGYVVVFESLPLAENAEHNVYRAVKKRLSRFPQAARIRPTAVYPEILLVLDHNAIRNHTIIQALRFILSIWNGADMVYSVLSDPKVYLNIAGIIISADDAATPYIANDTSIDIISHTSLSVHKLETYFAKELDRFSLKQYDMIIAMTPIKLCHAEADGCHRILGYTSYTSACSSEQNAKEYNEVDGVGIVYYNRMFSGVLSVVHETAHLFGVYHDKDADPTAACVYAKRYAMLAEVELRHQSLNWSPCSKTYFRRYFSSIKSECMDNTPMSIQPVHEVLPGRWLSLDGQCQNSGFEKSCRVPTFPVCMVKGCKAQKSNLCKKTDNSPLAGTKCGEKKYCNRDGRCVDERTQN